MFYWMNSYSQEQLYYLKITDDHFSIKKDSCKNIISIRLFVDKSPLRSFFLSFNSQEANGLANIKFYKRKTEIEDMIDYKWLVESEKMTVFTSFGTLLRKDKVYFVRDYNSEYFEVYETALSIEEY